MFFLWCVRLHLVWKFTLGTVNNPCFRQGHPISAAVSSFQSCWLLSILRVVGWRGYVSISMWEKNFSLGFIVLRWSRWYFWRCEIFEQMVRYFDHEMENWKGFILMKYHRKEFSGREGCKSHGVSRNRSEKWRFWSEIYFCIYLFWRYSIKGIDFFRKNSFYTIFVYFF